MVEILHFWPPPVQPVVLPNWRLDGCCRGWVYEFSQQPWLQSTQELVLPPTQGCGLQKDFCWCLHLQQWDSTGQRCWTQCCWCTCHVSGWGANACMFWWGGNARWPFHCLCGCSRGDADVNTPTISCSTIHCSHPPTQCCHSRLLFQSPCWWGEGTACDCQTWSLLHLLTCSILCPAENGHLVRWQPHFQHLTENGCDFWWWSICDSAHCDSSGFWWWLCSRPSGTTLMMTSTADLSALWMLLWHQALVLLVWLLLTLLLSCLVGHVTRHDQPNMKAAMSGLVAQAEPKLDAKATSVQVAERSAAESSSESTGSAAESSSESTGVTACRVTDGSSSEITSILSEMSEMGSSSDKVSVLSGTQDGTSRELEQWSCLTITCSALSPSTWRLEQWSGVTILGGRVGTMDGGTADGGGVDIGISPRAPTEAVEWSSGISSPSECASIGSPAGDMTCASTALSSAALTCWIPLLKVRTSAEVLLEAASLSRRENKFLCRLQSRLLQKFANSSSATSIQSSIG